MKPKLLCLCDSPTVYTGFANVVRNLVGRWQPNFEQIDIWGINYSGWPHTFAPIRIFPAGFGDWNTATKLTQFLNLLGSKDAGYTHLWILQDCNQLSGGDVPKYLRQIADARGIKVTFYYPVDSNLESRWLDCVAAADEAVTYTRYGYEQTRKVNHKIKPHVIPHGVDTTIYHPLANRMELRHQRFGKWLGNDDFLMVNVNRNERRKAPQHSLEILARLLKLGIKVKLLMHCPRQALNEGTDLELIGKQLGIPHGDHWQHHDKAHANYNGLLTEAGMNELYNCADLVLSTSRGEGWGLSLTEGAAAGCLVASPAHTSCLEITQTFESLGQNGQMHSLPLAPQCSVNMMDNSRVRHPVDVAGAAEVIARLAAQPRRFELNAAMKDWLNWDRIAREFLNVMLN